MNDCKTLEIKLREEDMMEQNEAELQDPVGNVLATQVSLGEDPQLGENLLGKRVGN